MTIPVVIQRLVVAIALVLSPLSPNAWLLAQTPSPTPSLSGMSLVSPNTGLDYEPLKKLLESQQWQAANEMTRSLMLKASGRGSQGWHTAEDIQNLPCWDLKTINDLWKTASNGRFSFSVQYEIFINSGNRPGRLMAPDAYEHFGDLVGWRKDNQWIIFKQNLNYSLDAPRGYLPNPRDEYQISGGRLEYTNLTKRLSDCQIVSAPSPTPKTSPAVAPQPQTKTKPKTTSTPKTSPTPKLSPSTPIMPKKN